MPLGWSGICCSQIPAMPFLGISGSGQLQAAFPRLRVNQVVSPWRGLQGSEKQQQGTAPLSLPGAAMAQLLFSRPLWS